MKSAHSLSIWFLIGLMLLIYGIAVTGSAVYRLVYPPATLPVLGELHADLWLGLFLLVVGSVYSIKFRKQG
ncbi:MAG TPA: hypothetical protein VIM58_01965 [Candidatus Methylacidiphilales bacterium]